MGGEASISALLAVLKEAAEAVSEAQPVSTFRHCPGSLNKLGL